MININRRLRNNNNERFTSFTLNEIQELENTSELTSEQIRQISERD